MTRSRRTAQNRYALCMAVNDLTAEAEGQLRADVAKRLLAAAYFVAQEHKQDLSRLTNPAPHKTPAPRGTWPAVRTGFGRSQVTVEDVSLEDLARRLRIRIGIRTPGKYLVFLAGKGWKGLVETATRVKAQALAMIRGRGA